jgi:hypothetical protein
MLVRFSKIFCTRTCCGVSRKGERKGRREKGGKREEGRGRREEGEGREEGRGRRVEGGRWEEGQS